VGYNKSHPFYRKKTMNFEEKTKNQGTSKPEASHSENGDIGAWACCEELVELDDVQLATVVGAGGPPTVDVGAGGGKEVRKNVFIYILGRWGA
jgi:hypothetical protein